MRWRGHNHGNTVGEIRDRIRREQSPVGWTHDAPVELLSVDRAHTIMQQHRECRVDNGPRKRAAFRRLVEAGRIKPDSGRTR